MTRPFVSVAGTTVNDTAVFDVRAPGVAFQDMTVAPRRVATGSGGGRVPGAVGIAIDAPAASNGTNEGLFIDLVIDGIPRSSASESTSSGIRIAGGASPTIGPSATIVGGDHSVLVTDSPNGASQPVIRAGAGFSPFFHSSQFACVRVESNDAANTPPSAVLTTFAANLQVHLQDCGGNGGVVVDTVTAGTPVTVDSTLIDAAPGGVATLYGVRLMHAGSAVLGSQAAGVGVLDVAGMSTIGIEAGDTSRLVIAGPVNVAGNPGVGVSITGTATADIFELTSAGNGSGPNGHGLQCDSTGSTPSAPTLVLRESTFLENRGDGVFIHGGAALAGGCVADLGDNATPGGNTYNNTLRHNGMTGLCYTTMSGTIATPTSSTWSCKVTAGNGCQAENPPTVVPTLGAQCGQGFDYSNGGAGSMTMPASGETCCGN
jgi:hypothetical protein